MATAHGRLDALQLASDWVDRALSNLSWVALSLRTTLVYQTCLFLLMGYDTAELRVWRNEQDNMEVVPLSILSGGE